MKTHLSTAIVFSAIVLSGCVGPAPIREYNLASAALKAAQTAGAAKHAKGYLTKAEDYYRKAERHYKDREYNEAKQNFRQAKLFAERAENMTALKKASSGGE